MKAQAEEERAKTSEEKFQKLKNMYTSIRDEHIALLRQVSIYSEYNCFWIFFFIDSNNIQFSMAK